MTEKITGEKHRDTPGGRPGHMIEYVIRGRQEGKTTALLQWLGNGEPVDNLYGWSRVVLMANEGEREFLQRAARDGQVGWKVLCHTLKDRGFTGDVLDLILTVTTVSWGALRNCVQVGIDNADHLLRQMIGAEIDMVTATGAVVDDPSPLGRVVDVVFTATADRPMSLQFVEAEIDGKSARFPFVSRPDGAKALRIPIDEDAADYRALADKVIDNFNPPDEDAAQIHILEKALDRAADALGKMICRCPRPEMPGYQGDNAYGPYDACVRCLALGRWQDQAVQR